MINIQAKSHARGPELVTTFEAGDPVHSQHPSGGIKKTEQAGSQGAVSWYYRNSKRMEGNVMS